MNEFERREARQNKEHKPDKGMVKATWVFTIFAIALFLLINFGMTPIRNAVVTSPEALLWWESLLIVSVMLVCAIALWVFYIIRTVKQYKEKNAFPPKYWSAWGIIKKCIAVVLTVLAIFIFTRNLTNTIKDVNDETSTVEYYVTKITSETETIATFEYLESYEDWVASKSDSTVLQKAKSATCYLYNNLDLTCNGFKFRYFKHSNTLVAMTTTIK